MKVYKCKFIYDNALVKVGQKFVIFNDRLVPHKSSNGLGIDVGLAIPFDKFFEEDGEIDSKHVPFLKKEIKKVKDDIRHCKYQLEINQKRLKEIKELK